MFLRFVVTRIHADSHQPQGLFATTYDLLEGNDLSAEVLKCRQLGNQIYQDEYQVAAIASRWDSRITAK